MGRPTIQDEYNRRVLTGDIYPAFVEMLKNGGKRKSLGDQSVNVAAGVSATKGGWIGMVLHVMAPDHGSAKEIIPAIAALLKSYGFETTSNGVISQLGESLVDKNPDTEDSEIWPKECPPLQRHGVRTAQR